MVTGHSPLPWQVETLGHTVRVVCRVVPAEGVGDDIAVCGAIDDPEVCANAASIVRAVNGHDRLIAAMEFCLDEDHDWADCRDVLRKALRSLPPIGEGDGDATV